jgi:hypothetical protein
LLGQNYHLAGVLARQWRGPTHGKNPFRLRDLPKVQLRTPKVRLQAARVLYLSDLPCLFLDARSVG